MAPPPAKRQKRLAVLGSDDEQIIIESLKSKDIVKHQRDSKPKRGFPANSNGTTTEPLTIRNRAKATQSSNPNSKVNVVSQVASTSTSKASSRKSEHMEKQPSRPISSFFVATSQTRLSNGRRQQYKADIAEKESEGEDLIEDDDYTEGGDESRGLQDTTRSILDRRERHTAPLHSGSVATNKENLPSGSQRFKFTCHSPGEVPDFDAAVPVRATSSEPDLRPWAEKYGPLNLEELMVHKKKVSDVRKWLEDVLRGHERKRLLILKGPSGAGKTTTISCLAKAMDFDILEWRNPIGSDYSSEGYLSMSARFDDFLGRSGRFNTLAIASNNGVVSTTAKDTMKEITRTKIVLIEEFPNTFLNPSSALRSFRSNILEYLIVNSPAMNPLSKKCQNFDHVVTPAVMIITETRLNTTTAASDNFTAHQLLGSEILSHPCVSIVEFNPIAPTLLTKALELVVTKEARHSGRRRISGPAVLKKLSETGDVRSAVGSLEFLCLRLEDGDGLGGRGAYRSKRGVNLPALTKLERESLEVVSLRESSLGLFHAVGKVVYNKRKDFSTIDTGGEPPRVPANDSPDHVRLRVSQVSVDHLIDETDTDIGTFIAALHENYVLSCEGGTFMDSLNGCLDVLSDCDILGSPKGSRLGSAGAHSSRSFQGAATDLVRQDEICFHIAVRGLLYALPDPVKRLTYPASGKMGVRNEAYTMFYPTSIRLSRQIEEIESLVCRWTSRFRVGINLFGHAKHDPSRQFAASTIRGQGPCSADNAGHPSEACENDIEPLRTSLGCTKHEMVLERLPYITRIVQGNRTSPHFNELDRITQFRGVNALIEECSDDDDSEVPSATPEWNTDLPAGGNAVIPALAGLQSEVTEVGKEANTQVFSVESDIGKLYLSEDDIEDE